jgi:uncharacterized protein (DUF1697 family)
MTPRKSVTGSIVYVALLRGINVGGNNMVSMKSLKASFEKLGLDDVSTYINSGNVLFRSAESDPRNLENKIDRMLEQEYDLNGSTVVRSYAEMNRLQKTITTNWQERQTDWRYNVIFLRHTIDSKKLVDGIVVTPEKEQVIYCAGTLLWCAHPDALNRTGMLKLSKQSINREMTVRNLNTTTKLVALMEQMQKTVG